MVKFTSTILALAATIVSAQDFLQPCNEPYDVCGWTLTNGVYGKISHFICAILEGKMLF